MPRSLYMATLIELTRWCIFRRTKHTVHCRKKSANMISRHYGIWKISARLQVVATEVPDQQDVGQIQDLLHVGILGQLQENQSHLKQVGVPQCACCGECLYGSGQSGHVSQRLLGYGH